MKFLFYGLYVMLPAPGILLYLNTLTLKGDDPLYALARILGIAAYVYFVGQLILAAKPLGINRFLGQKSLNALHILMAAAALLAAHGHWAIKFIIFQKEADLQTLPGFLALQLFLWVGIIALVFMAHTFLAKRPYIKELREKAAKAWNWTYKGLRVFHNLMVLAVVLMAAHVLLASSTQEDPLVVAYMAGWLGLGILVYGIYRIRGRKIS